jgi:glycine/D-amino acid oxidase-like deaminating enzyme
MGYTHNGVPIIGPVEGLEGQYIAAGFTGHGMPRTFAAYVFLEQALNLVA